MSFKDLAARVAAALNLKPSKKSKAQEREQNLKADESEIPEKPKLP